MSVNTYDIDCVAARLKAARGDTSQEALAARAGIKQAAYSNYERGNRDMPLGVACRVAAALSVDLRWLALGDVPDPAEDTKPAQSAPPDHRLARLLTWVEEWWAGNDADHRAWLYVDLQRQYPAFSEWLRAGIRGGAAQRLVQRLGWRVIVATPVEQTDSEGAVK